MQRADRLDMVTNSNLICYLSNGYFVMQPATIAMSNAYRKIVIELEPSANES